MLPDLENKIYFAHFVGRKPWVFWLKNENEIYSEHYYALGKEMVEADLSIYYMASNIRTAINGVWEKDLIKEIEK